MYNILIVDDDVMECKVIQFLLEQNNFPLEISVASNGEIALETLSEAKFDILFTDIQMPYIDGLTLAKEAKALYPDIQIIFYSGHDDFSYVKEALRLNACNYILKPVNREEFRKTITEVLNQLEKQEKFIINQDASSNFMQNHILYKLFNRADMVQLQKAYPQLDFSFLYTFHRLFLIQLGNEFFHQDVQEADTCVPMNLQTILPKNCRFLNLNPAQNILLFAGQKYSLSWYEELAEKISAHIETTCQVKCIIIISSVFSDPSQLSTVYADAESKLMEQFFFTDKIRFLEETAGTASDGYTLEMNDVLLDNLRTDIDLHDACSLKRHIVLFINSCKNNANISHVYFRFLSTNVLKLLLDYLPPEMDSSFDYFTKIIYYSNNIEEIESILMQLTNKLAAALEGTQHSSRHVLNQVKQYINQHYMENLSLDILAKEIYLTPCYLSALFIKETGAGINRYIKKVRMNKAEQLLRTTNTKISEICREVGYPNLSYFCKSFAEEYGMTPNQFRQTHHTTERK